MLSLWGMGSVRITALIFGTIGILKSALCTTTQRGSGAQQQLLRPNGAYKSPYHCRRQQFGFIFSKRGISVFASSNRLCRHRRFSTTNLQLEPDLPSNRHYYKYVAYIAVGSNLGDRFQNIRKALQLLELDGNVRLTQTSFLYETEPMYVTDQPNFLNGAVEIHTNLDPQLLLEGIKEVEAKMGRDFTTMRNGPRPVDLDILTYSEIGKDGNICGSIVIDTENLNIPHSRLHERDFVLIPFIDIAPQDFLVPKINTTLTELLVRLKESQNASVTGISEPEATRVLPLPRGRLLYFNETIIMGILNVTPDSFSDGGQWTSSIDDAVKKALSMEKEGAAIIDIGGESTRPGATEASADVQIQRTVPIIEAIRKGMLHR